ncbi:hypothetical protein T484DRAFT_1863923 [Baffinella frigidus]|nr:hypothetical protein T484DRAFT_1863923 [Cryptophyta sp. CCMP2293]
MKELAERRSLFAGFFMHPAFTQEGVQRAKDKEEARRQARVHPAFTQEGFQRDKDKEGARRQPISSSFL